MKSTAPIDHSSLRRRIWRVTMETGDIGARIPVAAVK